VFDLPKQPEFSSRHSAVGHVVVDCRRLDRSSFVDRVPQYFDTHWRIHLRRTAAAIKSVFKRAQYTA
jgi:hypothetical protein